MLIKCDYRRNLPGLTSAFIHKFLLSLFMFAVLLYLQYKLDDEDVSGH